VAEPTLFAPLFEFDYHPTGEDGIAYLEHLDEQPRMVLIETIRELLVSVFTSTVLLCLLHFKEDLGWLTASLLAIAAFPFALYWAHSTDNELRRKRYRRVESHLDREIDRVKGQNSRCCLAAEGVALSNTTNRRAWEWQAVKSVDTTARHVFFLVQPNEVIIVARRFFPDPAAFREFVRKAVEYHEQHKRIAAHPR
jgi:hypothetical protein